MNTSPFSPGTLILGAGALLLGAFLFVGFLLPGTWEVTRSIEIDASADVVFPHLDSPSAWREWTALPDTGLSFEGSDRGAGARMAWHHPEWGSGSFEILEARSQELVRYLVEVEGGAMRTSGTLRLDPAEGGTVVTWTETGDFGWNPLMGYWGLFMERAQGAELEKSLERLGRAVKESANETAPADSLSTGA
jgi:hypothetical protein